MQGTNIQGLGSRGCRGLEHYITKKAGQRNVLRFRVKMSCSSYLCDFSKFNVMILKPSHNPTMVVYQAYVNLF